MKNAIFKIDLKEIYALLINQIEEENESCLECFGERENYTLENYPFVIDVLQDYFIDKKIWQKIREKIIKMNKESEE